MVDQPSKGFSLDEFVQSPSVEKLLTVRKDDLLLVVNHYKVSQIKSYMKKSEILKKIVHYLVE